VQEILGVVPEDTVQQVNVEPPPASVEDEACRQDRVVLAPARFRPALKHSPLTQAVPYDLAQLPVSAAGSLRFRAGDALPAIALHDGSTEPWEPRRDLLSSRAVDKHFVVEVEADGVGRVRFGDGTHGERPLAGRTITATYRVGNGGAGNIGADTLVHIVSGEDGIGGVNNPLPARGGVEMETIEEVRQYAPFAFRPQSLPGQPSRPNGRTLGRAVTPADYAAVAETASVLERNDVQRAAATFRWTGSWRTVSVTVDRVGGEPVSQEFEHALNTYMEPYRLAGHDLEIEPPRPVALEITMRVRVKAGYFASQVRRALLAVFSNRLLPDGRRGVFHPDNLTFGQTIYLSPLYAAAQAVDGVDSADITRFQRRDRPGPEALDAGRLTLGRLEIARLDNDPNFPERGVLELILEGGR
jgi:predicted phage baseplate assembly protein